MAEVEGTAAVAPAGAPAAAPAAPVAAAAPAAPAPASTPAVATAPAAAAPAADTPEAKAAAAAADAVAKTAAAAKEAEAKVAEDTRRAALSSEARAAEDKAKLAEEKAKLEAEKTAKLEARRKLAPEKYKDFVPPEGVNIDAPVLTEFQSVARDLGLSQEDAQVIVDRLGPVVAKNNAVSVLSLARQASDAWIAASATDTEFGGEKFAENAAVAKKTFDLFGTPELAKFLKDSGMGNHPEMVRWAYRIGKLIGPDDKFIGGQEALVRPKTAEEALWPNSP